MVKIPLPAGSYPIDEHEIVNFRHWPGRKINRYGLHFDGVDDYVDCGNDVSLQGIKTVIALFYAQPQSEYFATIVAKAGWTGTTIQGWIMRYIGADFCFTAGDGTNAKTAKISDLAEGIHLATGVIDGSNNQIRLYIDGELKDANELYFLERDISLTLGYSAGLNTSDSYYKGNIYSVALYNRALSDAEISQMYDYVANGEGYLILDGLVLLLDFTEHGSNILYDKSGNNNHGMIYGATWLDEPSGKVDAFVPVVEG